MLAYWRGRWAVHCVNFPKSMLCITLKLYYVYSGSSPSDHSRKRPALVSTTFVKPRLNCDLNFVMKSSLPNWTFPFFLSSRKWPPSRIDINQHFNETELYANSRVYIRYKDAH